MACLMRFGCVIARVDRNFYWRLLVILNPDTDLMISPFQRP
jgi:hypothetical protein